MGPAWGHQIKCVLAFSWWLKVKILNESTESIESDKAKGWLNRTVAGAGITSALGDFCYETTTVILPGFLAVLGLPAAALGLIEGIADAVASFTKMISGYIADKLGHRKTLVLIGYGLTPVGQVLIALSAGWPLLLLGRMAGIGTMPSGHFASFYGFRSFRAHSRCWLF
ncbi:hypothetical protein JKG47_11215 [Acidithiobacillus sp. MC6.1]|uniref:MFS transporter n=1 Tax=Acidithiobacillus ferrivorans TaxID=160808 RepID=UPI0019D2BEC6|nr:MFS transporter [Acidithiobacillus ferrivorans]MBN6741090.1 hypothetical protein [Acidithiobacillus sp. MC6.1]